MLLVALALVAAGPAAAQGPEPSRVHLKARLGLTGSTNDLPSGWAPVAVHLENEGPARQVELEVVLSSQDGEAAWRLRRAVTLSAGQRWRTWVYVPLFPGGRSVEVLVRDPALAERADVLARTGGIGFNPRGADGYYGSIDQHVLVVGGPDVEQRDVSWLKRHTRNTWNAPTIQVAVGRPEDLPDRPEGFACLDLLVLHDADLSGLSRAQQDALVTWAELGGDVLLVPARRAEFFLDPVVKRLLDGRAVRMHEVDALPWLERAFGPFGTVRGRERFMVFTAGGPGPRTGTFAHEVLPDGTRARFLSALRCGAGTTWFLAADPAALPFQSPQASFTLAAQVGDELHADLTRGSSHREHPSIDPRVVRLVGVRRLPSQALVVALVLSFIVCVAPLNYLVLRRRDAQMMLVVTIPAISLVWTVLILITGYVTKGVSTEARRATLLEVDLGRRAAREVTAVSFMAAGAGDYDVAFAPGLLPTRLVREGSELRQLSQDLREDEGLGYPALNLGLWGHASFRAEAQRTLPGPLLVTPADGGFLLHNGTGLALDRAVYVQGAPDGGRDFWAVAGVAPGATARLTLLPRPASTDPSILARELASPGIDRELLASSLTLWSLSLQSGQVVATVEAPPLAVTVDGRRPAVELMLVRGRERAQ